MADLEFQIAKRNAAPITFTLGLEPGQVDSVDPATGASTPAEPHVYTFTPPKTASMIVEMLSPTPDEDGLKQTRAMFDWLGDGLSEDDKNRFLGRLSNKDDDLDLDNVVEVIKGLQEQVAGRPTT